MDNTGANLKVLYNREEVQQTVERLAKAISRDYQGKMPLLIGILKGSFIFMADLVRYLTIPAEIEFVSLSSYGKGMETSGQIKMSLSLPCPIEGRDVIIIEDIIDTGLTMSYFLNYLQNQKPASLKLCALVDKPSRRKVPVTIDYLGFTVPDRFIVGYGIDWAEKFRCLSEICFVENP